MDFTTLETLTFNCMSRCRITVFPKHSASLLCLIVLLPCPSGNKVQRANATSFPSCWVSPKTKTKNWSICLTSSSWHPCIHHSMAAWACWWPVHRPRSKLDARMKIPLRKGGKKPKASGGCPVSQPDPTPTRQPPRPLRAFAPQRGNRSFSCFVAPLPVAWATPLKINLDHLLCPLSGPLSTVSPDRGRGSKVSRHSLAPTGENWGEGKGCEENTVEVFFGCRDPKDHD